MKSQQIDVEVAIEEGEALDALISTGGKNVLATEIVEKHRVKAEEEVRRVGGRLRTDRAPEFYIRRGSDLINGGDFILSASRWWCEVPNVFDPAQARNR
jgi:hypothetical protein